MGKRKNRERAAAGMIFRDGRLWKKEDWEAAQRPPVPETRRLATPEEVAEIFGMRRRPHLEGGVIVVAETEEARAALEAALGKRPMDVVIASPEEEDDKET